ncbi:MAG: restriction endonuclease subunit S [Cyclobacteriaceae bacterium]|nr:restriction endonuclease subunit S [Cyclobacteriaceae bacterium]
MSEEKLPKGWKTISLDEISKFVIGGDWGKDPDKFWGEDFVEVACIRGSEIKNWGKEKGKTASIRLIKESSLEKRELILGDLLIEISGGGPDQPVGRVVRIDEEALSHNPSLPKVGTNFLRLLRLVDEVDNSYVNYYLQYFYHSGEVVKYQGGSNNLRNLKYKEYSKINIPLAPLPEQQRIVARLDAIFGHLDMLREKLDRIPELLKNFRQQVLTKAVTGELTREWRKGKDLGEWETRKMNDLILKIEAGKNFTAPEIPVSDGKVGLVKISAVTWGEFDENETKTVENEDQINPNYFIQKGDFLISRANTLELVGSSVIVKKINHQIMLSDKVWRVHFKNQTTKWFVHRFLKSPFGRKEIESRATGNQLSMRNLSQNNFKEIDIEFPPIEEQEEIVKRIDSLFNIADKIESQYQSLKAKIEQLPQAILAKAFRGELVGQDVKEYVREIEELGMVAEEGKAN